MPNRFCAICGKPINDSAPHFGMCLECYLKENPLFELPETLSIKTCIDCGSFSRKEEWIETEEDDIISTIMEAIRKLVLRSYQKKDNLRFDLFPVEESYSFSARDLLTSLDVKITGFLTQNPQIQHEQLIRVNINYELCKNCTNLRGGTFFLATIQLRVKDESEPDIIGEVLEVIQNYVEKLFETDNKQYISSIQEQKNGVDLLLSTNELMNHIISLLKTNYHFLIKRTKKLVGRYTQRGKNLYRLKTLIKFLPVKKNDIVHIRNESYIVETITKNRVILRKKDGSKIAKKYDDFFNEHVIINQR